MYKIKFLGALAVSFLSTSMFGAMRSMHRLIDVTQTKYLKLEFLSEEMVHFEAGQVHEERATWKNNIWRSPMVAETRFVGAEVRQDGPNSFETKRLKVIVNHQTLCVDVIDKALSKKIMNTCIQNDSEEVRKFVLDSHLKKNAYGLGSYFTNPGTADGDLIGRVWDPGEGFGNSLRLFEGGANGYALFPILYALGDGRESYALFLDHPYKQKWSFTGRPWTVETLGKEIRWFVFVGDGLKSLRQRYMRLTGRPPVPPKSAFGLWVSRFGYRNWDELYDELDDLEAKGFPVEGFALDLQWFGGRYFLNASDAQTSQMGRLEFDEKNFPSPREVLEDLRTKRGIEVMPIEEPYISRNIPEHRDLEERGFLVRDCTTGQAAFLDENPWWGIGGMMDWSNKSARDYWHDTKRQPLIDQGIRFHWTDLGEPEMYKPNSCYSGISELGLYHQRDIHNLYNLFWSQSIDEGYLRNRVGKRHFTLSRSGISGLQRYGSGMWSGDIGSNYGALTAHFNVAMHMSLSGIDYYGSDSGGFHRSSSDAELKELYTEWLANSSLFDFPVRPHAWVLEQTRQTSPARIGHLESNLANIRQRYELFPYYYALGHRAWSDGEPIVAPMVYEFEEDPNVRVMGHQKMIGPYLMAAVVAGVKETARSVYFPDGLWVNYHTNEMVRGHRQYEANIPNIRNAVFRIPLFIREGGIIPLNHVDEKTGNLSGFRRDSKLTRSNDFKLRVFPSAKETSFGVYEDDGDSLDYQKGGIFKTLITTRHEGERVWIRIHSKEAGKAEESTLHVNQSRRYEVRLLLPQHKPRNLNINGEPILKCQYNKYPRTQKMEESCWAVTALHETTIWLVDWREDADKLIEVDVDPDYSEETSVMFVCGEGFTRPGISFYVSGNIPQLGNFDPRRAIKLDPTVTYPTWTGLISGLPKNKEIHWKCLRRSESGQGNFQFSRGNNEVLRTGTEDYSGRQESTFKE